VRYAVSHDLVEEALRVRIWFWAWLLAGAVIAIVATATRDRYTAPWVAGAASAAGLEAFRVDPGWQWGAFFVVSAGVFLAVNRVERYRARHARGHRQR
jgi:membrane protein implicated in regulation of membrane protease activity